MDIAFFIIGSFFCADTIIYHYHDEGANPKWVRLGHAVGFGFIILGAFFHHVL
jgi:hypothetical protein